MEVDLPPLDAGATADYDDGLGPLDAGSRPDPEPKPEPVETPAPAPEPEPEPEQAQEPESEPDGDGDGDVDQDILAAVLPSDSQQPAVPPDWNEYQQWKAAQQSPAPPVQQPAAPQQPGPLSITEEEYDAAFASMDGMNAVLNKVHAAAVDNAVQSAVNQALRVSEYVVALNDVVKEHPDIQNYDEGFRRALAKTHVDGIDPASHVRDATALLRKTLTSADRIKSAKRVDVRGKQTAPKSAAASARELHNKPQPEPSDAGLDFLSQIVRRP